MNELTTAKTGICLPIAWALAPGDILFYGNCDLLTSFGSIKSPHEVLHEILSARYGVNSGEKLIQLLDWLQNKGDSAEFRARLSRGEPGEHANFFKHYGKLLNENSLLAWDLGRLAYLARLGEYVSFLDFGQTCRYLMSAASTLQSVYNSWESYFEHFLMGRRFRPHDPNPLDENAAEAYLLHNEASNWHRIPWNTPLNENDFPAAAQASPFHVDLSGDVQDVINKKDQYLKQWVRQDANNARLVFAYAGFKWQDQRDAQGAAQVFENAISEADDPTELYERYAQLLDLQIKDPLRAMDMYKAAADRGSALGLTALGTIYAQGNGVERDMKIALEYYHKAAELDHAHAQFLIGLIYQNGEGVSRNIKAANNWFMRAAKHNFSDAMLYLGFNYEHGQGFAKDFGKAINWYRRAADLQNPVALYNLGILYQLGNGVELNPQLAFQYFKRSATQGYASAMFQSGWCLHFGKGVETDYAKAMHWYQLAAARGDRKALAQIGMMYHEGLGVDKDVAKAEQYYSEASAESEFAKFQLGRLFFDQQDYEKAYPWIEEAARDGVAGSQRLLGYYYLNGHDPVYKNPKKALKWFEKAAKKNDAVAQFELGEMYDNRIGVLQRNTGKAEYWYERAAEQGNADAQFALGWYFENGIMEKPNFTEAYMWYHLAAEQQEVRAQKRIEDLQNMLSGEQIAKAQEAASRLKHSHVSPLADDDKQNHE